MRTINEYVELVRSKYKEDHELTGISMQECIDLVIDNAFFADEFSWQITDPLKEKVSQIIKKQK